jgi:hypothetical protein
MDGVVCAGKANVAVLDHQHVETERGRSCAQAPIRDDRGQASPARDDEDGKASAVTDRSGPHVGQRESAAAPVETHRPPNDVPAAPDQLSRHALDTCANHDPQRDDGEWGFPARRVLVDERTTKVSVGAGRRSGAPGA